MRCRLYAYGRVGYRRVEFLFCQEQDLHAAMSSRMSQGEDRVRNLSVCSIP
jgi:hypothetical protein